MEKIIRIGEIDFRKVIRPGKANSPWEKNKHDIFCKIEYKEKKLSISGVVGPLANGNAFGGCGQIDIEFEHKDKKENDNRYEELIKPENFIFAKGWDKEKWYEFLHIWKVWHLNDMKAGCEHQEADPNFQPEKIIEIIKYTWSDRIYDQHKKAGEGELSEKEYAQFKQEWGRIHEFLYREKDGQYYDQEEIEKLLHLDCIKEKSKETKTAGWVNTYEHPEGLLGRQCSVCGWRYGHGWKRKDVPEDVLQFLKNLPDTDKQPNWV